MTTGKPWSMTEQEICVTRYLVMLAAEQRGTKYVKAHIRRDAIALLDGRSEGSWEMKCCNISAALNDHGLPWIKGYKPLQGYQHSLVDVLKAMRPEWFKAAA